MVNVLDSTKQAYTESHHKVLNISIPNLNLSLTNANIVYESVNLQESIETEDELQFKGCDASQFKVSVAGVIQDVRDQVINVTITADNTETIPLFSGYIVEQTNRNGEDITTELTCYDPLYKLRNQDVTSWYNGLTFPITVKNFRNSFFTLLGLDQVVDVHSEEDTGDLINDSQTLTKIDSAKLPKVLNAGTIMECICQINARYGQYGRDKKFHYRQLREIMKGLYPSYETFPSPTTYPSGENADSRYDLSAYSKISYEPYTVEKITGVTIRDNEGNATSKGTATNVFTIADNMLASSLSDKATACQNILNEVKVVWYIPLNLECVGYPWIECGDVLLTRTKKNIVRSYVLQRTLKGIQALFDTIESEGLQTREEYRESEATGVSTNRSGVKDAKDGVVQCRSLIADEVSARQGQFNNLNTRLLDAEAITAIAVTTSTINSQTIYAKQITGGTVETGTINGAIIKAGTISASQISADAFSGNQFQGSTFRIGNAYVLSGLYVGGNLWKAEWKQFDQVPSGAYVLYHS